MIKYPIDLSLAWKNPKATSLDNLAQPFSELVVMNTRSTPWPDLASTGFLDSTAVTFSGFLIYSLKISSREIQKTGIPT